MNVKAIRNVLALVVGLAVVPSAKAIMIDGVGNDSEWGGLPTYNVMLYQNDVESADVGDVKVFADQSYVYALFSLDADSIDNLGFSVYKSIGAGAGNGVSLNLQHEDIYHTGMNSGVIKNYQWTLWKVNGVQQGSLPGGLEVGSSVGSGYPLVTEIMIPLSDLGGYNGGDTLHIHGGIDFNLAQHWYPEGFAGNWSYDTDIVLSKSLPDGGMTLALLGGALAGLAALRRKFAA